MKKRLTWLAAMTGAGCFAATVALAQDGGPSTAASDAQIEPATTGEDTPAPVEEAPADAAPQAEEAAPAEANSDGKVQAARTIDDCQPQADNRGRVRNPAPNQWTLFSLCAARMIGTSDDAVAMEALNRSDELGRASGDAVYAGNVGIRNAMMRAWLHNAAGRRAEADAEIARVRGIRRYSMGIEWALDRLSASFEDSMPRYVEIASSRVPDHPDLLRMLFVMHLINADMAGALPFAERMSIENPRPRGGWQTAEAAPVRQLALSTESNAMRAYVFAANGRSADSLRLLNEIDREINEFVGPAPVAPQGREVSRSTRQAYEARQRTGNAMSATVDRWKQAIAARARLAGGARLTAAQLGQAFPGAMRTAAALDLIRMVATEGAEEAAARTRALEGLETSALNSFVRVSRRELGGLLPEIETLERYPRFSRAVPGILMTGRNNGYTQDIEEGTGIRTIRFGTTSGSNATADELTLLATAETAQREGFDSFVLLSRRTVERRINYTGYGGGFSQDAGSEGLVRVLFTNSAALPAEWQAQPNRVIRVADVIASLGARQDAIEAARSAQRQNRR